MNTALNAIDNSNFGLPLDMGGPIPVGTMFAANASRFVESAFQVPLTQYAVGWRDPSNLKELLEFLAPGVQVTPRFEHAEHPNAEAFMSDADNEDLRAIGAPFQQIDLTGSKTTDRTYQRGLMICVDDDHIKEMPNWREFYTNKLMDRIIRNEIKRAFGLIIGSATNNAKTWDTTAGKDPDQDIRIAIQSYQQSVGVDPARTLITGGAWTKRQTAHRAQNTAGGFASALMTSQQVGEMLNTEIRVSKERYQSAAATKVLLAGSNEVVLIYHAMSGMSPEDPSNIKGFWSPCVNGGQRFAVYQWRGEPKFNYIAVEHNSRTKITSSLGIQSLTIS